MRIFSTQEFKSEFEKLSKKNSYKYLSTEIITSYFDKNITECLDGTRLNGHSINPFIKKRLGGSGGARLYLLAVIKEDAIYFSFLHAKSGASGFDNISNAKKTQLLNDVVDAIRKNNLFEITYCEKKVNLVFTKT